MRRAAHTDAPAVANASFTVPGIPVAKARARTVRHNGRTSTYTPGATAAAERAIGIYARQAIKRPLAGPLALEVVFYVPIPESFTKARKTASLKGSSHPAVRPDVDNYLKTVMDGCNRVAWFDDGQVCDLSARKVYSEAPRTEVRVWALNSCGVNECANSDPHCSAIARAMPG